MDPSRSSKDRMNGARAMTLDADVWPPALILTLVAVPLLAVVVFFRSEKSKKKYNLPPGPPKLPILGNMHQLMDAKKLPHQITAELAETYGPIMLMKIGMKNFVFVTSPDLAADITKAQDHLFADRPSKENLAVSKYLNYGDSHLTICPQGEYHNFFRKLIVTELLSQKKLQCFQATRIEEQDLVIREAFEAWSSAPREPQNLRSLTYTVMINVITRMTFSRKFFGIAVDAQSEDYKPWRYLIPATVELFAAFLVEDAIPALKWVDVLTGVRRRMQSVFALTDSLLQKLVEEHRQHLDGLSPKELEEFEPHDFMELVLLLEKREQLKHITDYSIKAIAADLIMAASETSSVLFEWILSELLANPDVMRKAQEEVDSVVGRDRCVHESDTPRLPYLAAVIKETFRLHPPVPWLIPRTNRVDCKVRGYDIPANSIINIHVYAMGRSPLLWENPLKFNPDRFLIGKHADIDVKGTHPQLMPFGAGRRSCPGMPMAHTITLPLLARLIHSFDLFLPNGVQASDMTELFGVTLKRKEVLHTILSPRLPHHLYNM